MADQQALAEETSINFNTLRKWPIYYLVMRGFCYIHAPYNTLYMFVISTIQYYTIQ